MSKLIAFYAFSIAINWSFKFSASQFFQDNYHWSLNTSKSCLICFDFTLKYFAVNSRCGLFCFSGQLGHRYEEVVGEEALPLERTLCFVVERLCCYYIRPRFEWPAVWFDFHGRPTAVIFVHCANSVHTSTLDHSLPPLCARPPTPLHTPFLDPESENEDKNNDYHQALFKYNQTIKLITDPFC